MLVIAFFYPFFAGGGVCVYKSFLVQRSRCQKQKKSLVESTPVARNRLLFVDWQSKKHNRFSNLSMEEAIKVIRKMNEQK